MNFLLLYNKASELVETVAPNFREHITKLIIAKLLMRGLDGERDIPKLSNEAKCGKP